MRKLPDGTVGGARRLPALFCRHVLGYAVTISAGMSWMPFNFIWTIILYLVVVLGLRFKIEFNVHVHARIRVLLDHLGITEDIQFRSRSYEVSSKGSISLVFQYVQIQVK
jgi:hypothetical protein